MTPLFLLEKAVVARPQIGLALSGGGVRGFAHIGVLRALDEMRVPVDRLAGTSVGALVGSLYAAGYSAGEIENMIRSKDWDQIIFTDRIERKALPMRRKADYERYLFDLELGIQNGDISLPPALVQGQNLSLILHSWLLPVENIHDFSQLPIPFQVVTTDLETGEMRILKSGSLVDSVRASASFPGFFAPVQIDGQLLFDGGPKNNLPTDIVRKMGSDIVIGINIAPVLQKRNQLKDLVQITDQVMNMVVVESSRRQAAQANILITPDLKDAKTFYYRSLSELIEIGRQSTLAEKGKFKPYQLSVEEYRKYRTKSALPKYSIGQSKIAKLSVQGLRDISEESIRRSVRARSGKSFKPKILEEDLKNLYAEGNFQRVDYSVKKVSDSEIELEIRAVEKPWGPSFLRLGATWDGEIKGKRDANAVLNFRMLELNRLGAEINADFQLGTSLEFDAEVYQPLIPSKFIFLAPRISASRTHQDLYRNEHRIAEYEVDQIASQVDLGIALKNYAEFRAGVRRGWLNSDLQLGDPTLPSYNVQTGGVVAQAKLDRLDSYFFPKNGYYLELDAYLSRSWLGADDHYRKLYGQTHGFFTFFADHTFFVSAEAGTRWGKRIPDYDLFELGGFRSLSGFREQELKGQYLGNLRAGYLWRLPISSNMLWKSIYLGGWFESGRTFNHWDEIKWKALKYATTGALGFETKIGSVFLGYGQSGTDYRQFYVSVGRSFGIRKFKFL